VGFLRLLRVWRLRLRSLFRGEAADRELHRELAFHFEELVAEQIEQGLTPDEARQAAHRAFGNVAALEESCRDERRVTWIHDLRQDIVYGVRMLRKEPGLTTIAALSLALGIGANAAVLGAFDALILQGLPVADADRLVAIQGVPLDNPSRLGGNSQAVYAALRDRAQAFDAVEMSIKVANDVAGDDPGTSPERSTGQLVTPGWLSMLGIEPIRGRVFTVAETQPYYPAPVVVISHAFWQRRFGADPGILTRQIRVQGTVRTVIGVMPAEFRYQEPGVDFWLPLFVGPQPDPGARLFGVRARLKSGVSLAQAQTELDAIAAQLAIEAPVQHKGFGVRVRPLNEFLFGWTRQPLLTLEAAVALVLLIACANVAALLLSRSSVRRREVALRAALGAGRWRLMRQLLTESVLLATAGGVLGLVVAVIGQRALLTMTTPPGAPPLTAIALNANVIALLALLTIGTGLVCGIVPAIRGSRLDPMVSLKEPGAAAGAARRRMLPQGVLVSVQLALALVLLIGSGLLLTSLVRQVQRDLNFDPDGLVRLDFDVPVARYTKRIGSHHGFPYFEISPPPSQTLERVLERLRALPGTESVAGISAPPVDAFVLATMEVALEDSPAIENGAANAGATRPTATYFLVTPNLFHTLRTPIVYGRDFTTHDTGATPWVAIVNETCARRFWPGQDPIGKRLTLDTVPEEQPREVIGVVRDIPIRHAESPQPVIYASYLQQPSRYRAPWAGLPGQMLFMIRPTGDPLAFVASARNAVAELEPERPLVNVSTMSSHLRAGTGQFRSYVWLVIVFAAVATLLAAIGTYGVMAYTVDQRTREIGIRRALGAGRREIVALVGRRAIAFVAAGLVWGLAGALALTRLIRSQLWGVTPTDPVTFAGVSVLLVAIALLACVIPARRALSVDPTIALRND
jgi:putative ABC transport system permease protein